MFFFMFLYIYVMDNIIISDGYWIPLRDDELIAIRPHWGRMWRPTRRFFKTVLVEWWPGMVLANGKIAISIAMSKGTMKYNEPI